MILYLQSATYLVDTLSFRNLFSAPNNITLSRKKNVEKKPALPFNVACFFRKITAVATQHCLGERGTERTSQEGKEGSQ